MASFFSKEFWVEGGEKKPETKPDAKEGKVTPPSFGSTAPAPATTVVASAPTVTVTPPANDEILKYRQHIKDVMRQNNQDGPDYFEFSEGLDKNAHLNLPKSTAFVVAFNFLNAGGLTKQKLLDTARFYIAKLREELDSFKKDREQRRKSQVEGREQRIAELQQKNQQIAEQIQKLSQEMETHRTEIETLQSEKAEAERKLMTSTAVMEQEINSEIARIESDIQLIETTIQ